MASATSSSRARMAPRAAMMADTPQIELPMASRLTSFGRSPKRVAQPRHDQDGRRQLRRYQQQRRPAQPHHVPEQEPHAQQHDAQLQPELVCRHARTEDARHAEDVGDDQAVQDRPQHVFDVGHRRRMRLAPCRDRALGQLARIAQRQQQRQPRQQRQAVCEDTVIPSGRPKRRAAHLPAHMRQHASPRQRRQGAGQQRGQPIRGQPEARGLGGGRVTDGVGHSGKPLVTAAGLEEPSPNPQYGCIRKQDYTPLTRFGRLSCLRSACRRLARSTVIADRSAWIPPRFQVAGSPATASHPCARTSAATSAMQASSAATSVPLATNATPPPVCR